MRFVRVTFVAEISLTVPLMWIRPAEIRVLNTNNPIQINRFDYKLRRICCVWIYPYSALGKSLIVTSAVHTVLLMGVLYWQDKVWAFSYSDFSRVIFSNAGGKIKMKRLSSFIRFMANPYKLGLHRLLWGVYYSCLQLGCCVHKPLGVPVSSVTWSAVRLSPCALYG